jgi:phosphohistidine phosphatase SixA
VYLFLVHHGDAVGPEVDHRRPLSERGRVDVDRLAAQAAARGVKPAIVWHSGKLRAKQTAEAFWRACNALATLSATRDLQPDDPPEWMRSSPRRIHGHPHCRTFSASATITVAADPRDARVPAARTRDALDG